MRRDRSGVALIFDALAFLTIISIVAVAMMQFVRVDVGRSATDDYVEEVHRSLLACTFLDIDGPTPFNLLDATRSSFTSLNGTSKEMLLGQIEKTLDSYLEPEYRYEWTATMGEVFMTVGDLDAENSRSSIYISTVQSQATGSQLAMTLKVGH